MLKNICEIAKKLNLAEDDIELYGKYKAKIVGTHGKHKGKLVLVTAINPTKFGEGKTTISIGLGDALNNLGQSVCLALREPSLGPVFGLKGGATGGGKARVEPSDDINLHFTGDFHAITSANNLLASMIDNHIFFGNELGIERVVFGRCVDLNDRALRQITISQEKLKNNKERTEHFDITAASEIMAVLCLAKNLSDLKRRCGNILVAYTKDNKPIYAKDLKAEEAMTILLKDAIKPNLVQTLENTPAIIHGGPFANIAHGCNSVIATKTALSLADYVVTEAGFGSDLGGEKFLDVKCRLNNLNPNVVVVVATIKALKLHGNDDINTGFANLEKHVENMKNIFNKNVVVALNRFSDDSLNDINLVKSLCKNKNFECIECNAFSQGGKGCLELGKYVINACNEKNVALHFAYNLNDNIEKKIYDLATKVYGAKEVFFEDEAKSKLAKANEIAKGYPIVTAKTQYSFSDNPDLLGAPKNYRFVIRDIEVKTGAEFVVLIAGKMSLMPGLPKIPNAEKMEIKNGKIFNLK